MSEQDKSTKSLPATCRVFISDSHDSTEHQQRVRALADRLRENGDESCTSKTPMRAGCATRKNRPIESHLSLPKPTSDDFEGDEQEGRGLGAAFEGVIVTQALYESGGQNAKFRPVVFHEEDERFIPSELRRFNRYRIDTPENYEVLLRWLHKAPEIVAPPVRPIPDLTTKPASFRPCNRLPV